jgi:ubiquinone/menaquinone biosynthesis C-methylase UbiE
MLLRAQRKNNHAESAINLVQADAECLPFKSALANTTIAMGVLQHVPSAVFALSELRRVAVAGSRVLVIDESHSRSRVLAAEKYDNVTLFEVGEYFVYQS